MEECLQRELVARKSSFFVDFERRDISDNAFVNAVILDLDLNPTQFSTTVFTPRRRTTLSARLDFQLNSRHTLGARYTYTLVNDLNGGVGGFSLPSRSFDSSGAEQTAQLTEAAVLGQRAVNEARFQSGFAGSLGCPLLFMAFDAGHWERWIVLFWVSLRSVVPGWYGIWILPESDFLPTASVFCFSVTNSI